MHGISKVLSIRKNAKETICTDIANEGPEKSSIRDGSSVHVFDVPTMNLKAASYYELVDEEAISNNLQPLHI